MVIKCNTPLNQHIKFGNGQHPKALKLKDPTEPVQQLGVKNNPVADPVDDVKDRADKSITISTRVTWSAISPKNAYWLYQNIWFPAM
eukprot:10801180-Ditylum_brightwellii.AAC.1